MRSSVKSSQIDESKLIESNDRCNFCISQFNGKTEQERLPNKRAMLKKLMTEVDTLFEFFSLCLVSYKLNDTRNTKIISLDKRELYKQVTQVEKLPFNKWNKWLGDYIEKLTLENMYMNKVKHKDFTVTQTKKKVAIKEVYF